MNPSKNVSLFLVAFVFALTFLACEVFGSPVSDQKSSIPPSTEAASISSPTSEPNATSVPDTSTPEETPLPENTPVPETSTIPPTEVCTEAICFFGGNLILQQPIDAGGQNRLDYSSRFGSYRASSDTANRGVYYLVSSGTPVLAVADGTVVVAGNDSVTSYGPATNTYGNLVILQHQLPGLSEPVFTLYGHLAQVLVEVNATVRAGDEIGQVGSSGNITGSTLIFEVREGNNDLVSLHNPELWLAPLTPNAGAIAGRILDGSGNYLSLDNVVIERLGEEGQPALDQYYLQTYTKSDFVGLSPFEENFAIGELPAGQYQITFYLNQFYQLTVEVKPGEVTRVTFTIP